MASLNLAVLASILVGVDPTGPYDVSLSQLRTYLPIQAQAGTLANMLQTKFVIHQYKGRTLLAILLERT